MYVSSFCKLMRINVFFFSQQDLLPEILDEDFLIDELEVSRYSLTPRWAFKSGNKRKRLQCIQFLQS